MGESRKSVGKGSATAERRIKLKPYYVRHHKRLGRPQGPLLPSVKILSDIFFWGSFFRDGLIRESWAGRPFEGMLSLLTQGIVKVKQGDEAR